jgi:hypothetical protein
MASDVAATSLAFVLFSLFVFVPGYVLSWCLDLLGFRSRTLPARFVISVPVSIAAFPVLTYLAWHWSANAVLVLFGACWLAFCVLFFVRWRRTVLSRRTVILCGIVAGWVVLGMFLLIDLQIKNRLYFPTVSYDYMLRSAITSSITRSGVPPNNPYFFPGQPFPLRYHYFWYLPCSLVDRLGGSLVSARHAIIAGTLWCGIGLMAMVPLYLRFFQPKGAMNLEKRTIIGIALLGVTGLDLIPTAMLSVLRGGVVETIEWWNAQVTAWITAVLWVPHHVAALIACLTGLLVIYHSLHRRDASRIKHAMAAVAGGVMFASAIGLSSYVTLAFAAALGILVLVLLLKRYSSEAAILASSGIVAVAVAVPYLMELSGGSGRSPSGGGAGGGASAGPLFQLTVRPFTIADRIVQTSWPDQSWLVPVTNLVLLPVNYFLELGLFSMVGVVMFRKLRRTEHLHLADLSAFVMAATSILICTFLRSSVITNNDLGWRGFLIAQFFLLIWAAELWDEGFFAAHAKTALIAIFLLFGIGGTVYEISMVRFYTLISDDFAIPRDEWFPADHHLGERTFAMRELYEQLQRKLPGTATLQHNPNQPLGDVFHGLYADRQAVVETPGCGVVFGGDSNRCNTVMPAIAKIFENPEKLDWRGIEASCRDLSIDALVVKDTDAVWADQQNWVWTQRPLVANHYARAFLCGNVSFIRSWPPGSQRSRGVSSAPIPEGAAGGERAPQSRWTPGRKTRARKNTLRLPPRIQRARVTPIPPSTASAIGMDGCGAQKREAHSSPPRVLPFGPAATQRPVPTYAERKRAEASGAVSFGVAAPHRSPQNSSLSHSGRGRRGCLFGSVRDPARKQSPHGVPAYRWQAEAESRRFHLA